MTQAFESLINQLNDEELACYFKELARANDIIHIRKIISNIDPTITAHHVLLSSFEFKDTYQGSAFWKDIFNRLKPTN